MGTSLTGLKIKDSYSGLLKTSDNGALGASAKQITDGLGTGSPLSLSTSEAKIDGLLNLNTGGVLQFGANTSTPSIGAGIHRPANYTLAFVTATAERMRIDSSGNIRVKGNATRLSWERTSDSAPDIAYFTKTQTISTNGEAVVHGYDGIIFKSSGSETERMRIDSSGNVGIGGTPSTNYPLTLRSRSGDYTKILDWGTDSGSSWGQMSIDVASPYGTILNSGEWQFKTNGTERMRITSGGALKASNTGSYLYPSATSHELVSGTSTGNIAVLSHSSAATPYGIIIHYTGATPNNNSSDFISCQDSTTTRLKIYSNGNVVNTNNSYGAISDAKLKENVTDASPKLDDLMQVQVRNFNYIGDDKKQLGVVAQELETIFPAMIDESADFEEREVELRDENGEIVYETEQVLVSEAVAEYTETIEHAEELDEEGNVIAEAWTEEIVHPAKEAVYETVTTDRPVMTTERVDLGTTTKSVKYSVFVPMLIKAIQELKAEVDALKGA